MNADKKITQIKTEPVDAAKSPDEWHRVARTLSEALPYMRRYSGKTVVIKYGGNAMTNDAIADKFARDVVLIKQVGINPVVVHGGGPQIGDMLAKQGIKSEFINGLRVTDRKTIDVVEAVLSGTINKGIVDRISDVGGNARGLSGKDGLLIEARKLTPPGQDVDLGFVGEPVRINTQILDDMLRSDAVPVIAPLGIGEDGETYNINADTAAGAIAAALAATRLYLLTDVSGVLDDNGELITDMNAEAAEAMVADGTIYGGMIPKITTCTDAVANGVQAAVIMDGRVDHALLLEMFTEHGAGTLIGTK